MTLFTYYSGIYLDDTLMNEKPAAKSNDPIEHAWPIQTVATGGDIYCMVS